MRREYIRTANELQRMLLMLHTRSRAATTIQSAWRGWRQRQVFLPVWQQYLEQKSALVLQRVCGIEQCSLCMLLPASNIINRCVTLKLALLPRCPAMPSFATDMFH
jgi:hypothetical protein